MSDPFPISDDEKALLMGTDPRPPALRNDDSAAGLPNGGCMCPIGGPFRDICPVHYSEPIPPPAIAAINAAIQGLAAMFDTPEAVALHQANQALFFGFAERSEESIRALATELQTVYRDTPGDPWKAVADHVLRRGLVK